MDKILDNTKKKGRKELLQKFQDKKESKVVNKKKEEAILLIQRFWISYSSNKKLYESIWTDDTKPCTNPYCKKLEQEKSKKLWRCKFSKKLKVVEMLEKKNKSQITIKMINKLLSEFNLITKIAPKPIKYNRRHTTKVSKFSGKVSQLRRTEIVYEYDLEEMMKFLKAQTDLKFESSKLYLLIDRVMLISDQDSKENQEFRRQSYKLFKDLLSTILNQLETYSAQLRYNIIDFVNWVFLTIKKIIESNSYDRLINKEAILSIILEIINPIDKLYKTLRNVILSDTKGLLELSPAQKKMIYQSIILSKNLFSLFSSQSEEELKAIELDKLIPKIPVNTRYNKLVALNESFVTEIMSIPRAGQYIYIMLKKKNFGVAEEEKEASQNKDMLGMLDDLNFKNCFNAFWFSKMSRKYEEMSNEEEKIENKSEAKGSLLYESQKNEKKMFIFANWFILLNKYFLKHDLSILSSILQILDNTVVHLPDKLFSEEENYLETNFNMFILKNQLNYLVDSKTVKSLFSQVLPSNSEMILDEAVISLWRIYSMLMMLSQRTTTSLNHKNLNFVDIISIGLAFNTDLLYSLWKFIITYFDPNDYSIKTETNSEIYNTYAHLIWIFSQSIIRSLWISSIEEFNKETKFTKEDVINIVLVLKQFVVNTILSKRIKFELDKFIVRSGSSLIRMLYDMFNNELSIDDMNSDLFNIKDIEWEYITEIKDISEEINELVFFIPEWVPFNVRAIIFNDEITTDRMMYRGNRYRAKINRQNIFEDGFQTLSQIDNLKWHLMITFVNEYGIQEEGQDAGGIFKEFLVEISRIIFDPNFGFFTKTDVEEDLYPNPSNSLYEHLSDDTILKYFEFFGKILGKAMFEGVQIAPQFAKFFLKRLANKSNMISDLKFLDKDLFKSLNFLKTYTGDFEDLWLTFSCSEKDPMTEEVKTFDLVPHGGNIPVTSENKFKYIYLMMDFKLNRRIIDKLNSFVKGFYSIIPVKILRIFTEDEIQKLISGASSTIDVNEWRKYTKYIGGFDSNSKMIKMFWKVVEEMTDKERSLLLQFVTSCPRQPLMGFKYMDPPFTISKVEWEKDKKLPSASTWFNVLRLPYYSSTESMYEKILIAIKSNAGFEMA